MIVCRPHRNMAVPDRPCHSVPRDGHLTCIRVSVVTPSLNKAQWLRQTLESVLAQEGGFELEFFVVDGGSCDGSVDILGEVSAEVEAGRWRGRCERLQFDWISGPDGGQTAAINRGLERCTGDIACYLNADDLLAPGALRAVVEAFTKNPDADFIYGDGDVIDEHGNVAWEWLSRPYSQAVMTGYHYLWNDFTNYIMQQAVFWRTCVHSRIGLFDESFHYAMDVEYWVRAGSRGLRLQHIPRKLACFRLIAGTKSLSGPLVFWPDYIEIFRRYRRQRPLIWPLAFYYFNSARSKDGDLNAAVVGDQAVIGRWQALPAGEQQRLRRQRDHAIGIAASLLALEWQQLGRRDRGDAMLTHARSYASSSLAVRLAIAGYRARAAMGSRARCWMDMLCRACIDLYKRKRYRYRYTSRRQP